MPKYLALKEKSYYTDLNQQNLLGEREAESHKGDGGQWALLSTALSSPQGFQSLSLEHTPDTSVNKVPWTV